MSIDSILTEAEYTKERSAEELFRWFTKKNEELQAWSQKHPGIKYRELSKNELPKHFLLELTPFAYYAKTYYSSRTNVKFKPCCHLEHYDGIITDNGDKIFMEITNAIFGDEWAIIKELLVEKGYAPWEHSILGANKSNRAQKKKKAIDLITCNETEDEPLNGAEKKSDTICQLKKLVKETAEKKCKKSCQPSLRYGQNKTILIITFDDTGFIEEDWKEFMDFKRNQIDSISHKFKEIDLFGWITKVFLVSTTP